MGLKKKKFVIQWRKFESKRPFKLKVMNLLSLYIFLDFILIFQEFLEIKIHKKRFIKRMTHVELTWHNADTWSHHLGRYRPTWAPT